MPSEQIYSEQEPVEQSISISRFIRLLQRYAGIILVALASVALLYLIIAILWWLRTPSIHVTSMPFRLEFKGADEGRYPNGLRFSPADVSASPVLLEVFNANDLQRWIRFDQFARAVIVLESNQALERLMAEYQAKLSDPRLTPVDRDRLERDFEGRRASISKADYSIQLILPDGAKPLPPPLAAKVLRDTLAGWARRAAVEKRALSYQISVLSPNVFSQIQVSDENYLVPLLLLRKRLDDLRNNVADVTEIPGAQLVRTRDGVSIAELDLAIDEIVRYRVEPLIATARARGLVGSTGAALDFLRTQLSYDERLLEAARRREEALRRTLAAYEAQQAETPRSIEMPPRELGSRTSETVMPQFNDSFLERIVDLSSRSADREYRQKLTDEIKDASLAVIPAEMAVRYDRELLESFQRAGAASNPGTPGTLRVAWETVLGDVRQLTERVTEIYHAASRQLYPETELFRTLGPAVTRQQRGVSPVRLALIGALTMLIALPIIIVAVLIHSRVREERASEAHPAVLDEPRSHAVLPETHLERSAAD